MFTLLDADGSGYVDLSEYLTCVLMVDRSGSRHEMLDMAFELYGGPERLISRKQATSLLRLLLQITHYDAHKFAKDIPASHDGLISHGEFVINLPFSSKITKKQQLFVLCVSEQLKIVII